ncbi:acetyl esterase/lipase [Sinomonas atrocyanea]|uniref:alpha/beta hydrolase n=1 Tax=Sinomonas atrocyanea TaxID=37927 RepID=UPI00277E9EFF|nr:alpha/beta hydrolase [Sinomonas atrocyanea]MDP9884561.1 acetyl esterase/lipase [Sinomonas atrocyanea]
MPDIDDLRRMSVAEMIGWLTANGEPDDPRTDIDTASLVRRFPRLAGVQITDRSVPGPRGDLPTRIYSDPASTPTGFGLVWFHGGGFVGGTLDMPESHWVSMELAARGIPVVAADYTKCLGGVHYPAPSDDALAVFADVRQKSMELLGVPPQRLLLGGASAGSALAAGAVERRRRAGNDVPAGLLLVYPALHPSSTHPGQEPDAAAPHGQLALNFAGSAEALADPCVFPGLGDGYGCPPTLVVVCEEDDLRPSGEAFAETLRTANVAVELYLERDAHHGHIDRPELPEAHRTLDRVTEWVGRL